MSLPQLSEDPVINLNASGPYLRHIGSSDRATIGFRRLEVVSAAGGVKLPEGVEFTFDFDHSEPDTYALTVDQPFRGYGRSRRPDSEGGYRLRLPWWMLQPLLSVPADSPVQLEFTRTSVNFYATPAEG